MLTVESSVPQIGISVGHFPLGILDSRHGTVSVSAPTSASSIDFPRVARLWLTLLE